MLGTLDLDPVILHEQPNKGRTIIEKFEDFSDVGFAVILLTGDDMGYLVAKGPDSARPRERQNVILELGFFLGRLTRARVVALYSPDPPLELPSDYDGVLFVPLDAAGAWKLELVRELRAAGIDVDANKLLALETDRR
ncbi:MAG TPA: nucleotide-binding protein [Dehalococcoidia bacterium]|nr:nucleotide-binding protein [Dehalococcoidia bacterium]